MWGSPKEYWEITTLQEAISKILGCMWLDLNQRDDVERDKVGVAQLESKVCWQSPEQLTALTAGSRLSSASTCQAANKARVLSKSHHRWDPGVSSSLWGIKDSITCAMAQN